MDVALYEQEYKRKKHFSFGKNWQKFLKTLNNEKIIEAKKSLTEFLGDIKGRTFIDVGCGSGLFSLAAHQLGAKVISTDVDDYSIQCARYLKEKYGNRGWVIKKGSALDKTFVSSLGKYDIVYSWGVLHHTGNMWRAIETVSKLVKPKGRFYMAIYNNNTKYKLEGTSKFWHSIKKIYNNTNAICKKMIYFTYLAYLLIGLTVHGINPIKYIKNYKTNRGMNFFTDVKDWLGGFPYEYATPEEVISHLKQLGFKFKKIKKARSLGCNEFLFTK